MSSPTQRLRNARHPASDKLSSAERLLATLRALPLACAVALVAVASPSAVHAQSTDSARKVYSVSAGSLEDGLNAFARQAGVTLSFDPAMVRGKTAPALHGSYTVQEGLSVLLKGSGLDYVQGSNGISLRRSQQIGRREQELPGITVKEQPETAWGPVTGYVASRSATATKSDTPIIGIPQSISVITRDQMDAQQVDSVKQALRYSAGVTPETRANFSAYDIIYGRGFIVDRYLDGMRLQGNSGFVTPQAELYGIERVDLLRGPASVLFGQGSPAGLVNMVSKRPTDRPLHEVQVQGGSHDHKQIAFDLGGPIDAQGEFLYRLTGLLRDSNSQVDFVQNRRTFIAPSFTWKPSTATSLTVLMSYQDDPKAGLYNFVPSMGSVLPNPNGKIPTHFYAGDPNFNRVDRKQYSLGYLFEHRFDNDWTVRQNLRYQDTRGHLDQVLPFGLEPDNVTLDRYTQATREHIAAFTLDNQAERKFSTGALRHTLLFGIDYQRTLFNQDLDQDLTSPIDLFNPVYYQPIAQPSLLVSSQRQTQRQTGFYVQDQIKVGALTVVASGRHDRVNSDTADVLAGISTPQNDHANTGRIGVSYRFESGFAPYATYATSFQPTAGADFSARPFKPTTGKLHEAGVKFQPRGYNSFVTVSVYQLTQQNVTTVDTDPAHVGFLVQTGEVRSRGLEIEGKLSLTRQLDLIGSYTYTDATVTRSNDVDFGKTPLWIPRNAAALWADYTQRGGPLSGLGLGLGVRYVGETYGDMANTLTIPSYTVADAALHYDLSRLGSEFKGYRFSVNVSNLFDKSFVSECTNANCLYGLRRTALATVRYRW